MVDCPSDAERINSFSLVSYIPGRLGDFLNDLRQELVPGCHALAHVTVLPPRPLATGGAAGERLVPLIEEFPAFDLELIGVRKFGLTDVVYAEIGLGRNNLEAMHDAMNRNELYFKEPYEYHPHITLAQNMPPEEVEERFEQAQRRWRDAPARSFEVTSLTFVQNTVANRWVDLLTCELRGAPSLRL